MLFHPDVYFKDCDSCEKYVMVDGEPYLNPVTGEKVRRVEGEKPNCKMCERSSLTILSVENWMTWQMYLRHKHMGLEAHERRDSLVQRHMIMLGEIDQAANMSRIGPMMGFLNG